MFWIRTISLQPLSTVVILAAGHRALPSTRFVLFNAHCATSIAISDGIKSQQSQLNALQQATVPFSTESNTRKYAMHHINNQYTN